MSELPAKTGTAAAFRVRQARRGDADAIRGLLVELGFSEGVDGQTVHWIISHPEMEIYVAADSHDRPIGLLSLSHRPQLRTNGRVATIDELIVSATWRRKGVGRALIRQALERAKVMSVKQFDLILTSPSAQQARDFLRACGLTETEAAVFRLPQSSRK